MSPCCRRHLVDGNQYLDRLKCFGRSAGQVRKLELVRVTTTSNRLVIDLWLVSHIRQGDKQAHPQAPGGVNKTWKSWVAQCLGVTKGIHRLSTVHVDDILSAIAAAISIMYVAKNTNV